MKFSLQVFLSHKQSLMLLLICLFPYSFRIKLLLYQVVSICPIYSLKVFQSIFLTFSSPLRLPFYLKPKIKNHISLFSSSFLLIQGFFLNTYLSIKSYVIVLFLVFANGVSIVFVYG